jgi:hypothetical protein
MTTKSWTALFKDYKGQWVALKEDEATVISSGEELSKVIRQAADKGYEKPILAKIPQKDMAYIGSL